MNHLQKISVIIFTVLFSQNISANQESPKTQRAPLKSTLQDRARSLKAKAGATLKDLVEGPSKARAAWLNEKNQLKMRDAELNKAYSRAKRLQNRTAYSLKMGDTNRIQATERRFNQEAGQVVKKEGMRASHLERVKAARRNYQLKLAKTVGAVALTSAAVVTTVKSVQVWNETQADPKRMNRNAPLRDLKLRSDLSDHSPGTTSDLR